jgi:nitric oxide reductase subunit B
MTPPMANGQLRHGERAVLLLMGCAMACAVLSVLSGSLGALYAMEPVARGFLAVGVSLAELRPLHTSFASAWIYLGAVAAVTSFLYRDSGEPSDRERRRFRVQMVLWGLAGAGILLTVPFGITSGREYMGFHPALSLLIGAGWLLFAWTFFSRVSKGFWQRPAYVYMWAVGILYFLWTFAEGHAWLLPSVRSHPVADLQIQWKSCGTLVAAFNQMVYGSLMYIGERRSGDKAIAQSKSAFALFGIGLLNSFTNYAHHTYHLPQSHIIKWVAFVVSMLEIIILVIVFKEVVAAMAKQRRLYEREPTVTDRLFGLSKTWNLFLLTVALLISVPPLNALIHGTHVVMAHAMGSMLAIDSYILLGVFAVLLTDVFPKREVHELAVHSPAVRRAVEGLNVCLAALVILLLARGLTTGVTRYLGLLEPGWVASFPLAFAALGIGVGWMLLRILLSWAPLFLRPAPHKTWREEPRAG